MTGRQHPQAAEPACLKSDRHSPNNANIAQRLPQQYACNGLLSPAQPAELQTGAIPQNISSMSHRQRSGPGLVQQTVQIVAALRLHDLTLFVRAVADLGLIVDGITSPLCKRSSHCAADGNNPHIGPTKRGERTGFRYANLNFNEPSFSIVLTISSPAFNHTCLSFGLPRMTPRASPTK